MNYSITILRSKRYGFMLSKDGQFFFLSKFRYASKRSAKEKAQELIKTLSATLD